MISLYTYIVFLIIFLKVSLSVKKNKNFSSQNKIIFAVYSRQDMHFMRTIFLFLGNFKALLKI
jgi:hypothetical protein